MENKEKLKGLSKIIYIIARIGKVIFTVLIPLIVLVMLIIPSALRNVKVEDNALIINSSTNKIKVVEEEKDNKKVLNVMVGDKLVASENAEDLNFSEYLTNFSKGNLTASVEIALLMVVATLILLRFICMYFEKLFTNIYESDSPFSMDNATYLRKASYLMIGLMVVPIVLELIYSLILKVNVELNIDFVNILEILFVIAMSHVFEYGSSIENKNNKVVKEKNE